ncbi:hypothetical protein QMK33_03190 [Hymenobacter sp. H14-R3]|uniref:hypothetical protein n=1 Tax=Hymenobacter sp. H14-R3 TaxID=3046308 RepID=UPI0024B938D3|nr:hypothetical protein [Hymenobacter sp. H14-R3]MDJ0364143.1 hypothetical protein [Hymenobacter sp. H14-R3]
MKTSQLFGAALLGLAISFSAHAQTPVRSTAGAPVAPNPAGMPNGLNTVPAGAVPANATTPIGSSGGRLYPVGSVPTRNVNGGTQRADQPTIGTGRPATIGGQPTRRINKGRASSASIKK